MTFSNEKFFVHSAAVGELDANGFLRVKLRVAKVGILPYQPNEIEGFEGHSGVVNVLRDEAELFDPESMKSLEGVPLLIGHSTLAPGTDKNPVTVVGKDQSDLLLVGSVSGASMRNGKYLIIHGLITHQGAIDAVKDQEIIEISTRFKRVVIQESGVWQGQPYDAKFGDIYYNHVALLPPGIGRGGPDLRITNDNKNGGTEMPDIIVRTPHGNVATNDAGAAVLGAAIDAATKDEKELKETKDQLEGLTEKAKQVEGLNAQIAELTAARDKITGELDAAKVQIEQLMSPEAIQGMVAGTVEAQDAAATLEKNGTIDALPPDWKRLSAVDLKKLVIGKYLPKSGNTNDSKDDPSLDYIDGVWKTLTKGLSAGKTVPVAGAVRSSQDDGIPTVRSFAERLGYKPEKPVK